MLLPLVLSSARDRRRGGRRYGFSGMALNILHEIDARIEVIRSAITDLAVRKAEAESTLSKLESVRKLVEQLDGSPLHSETGGPLKSRIERILFVAGPTSVNDIFTRLSEAMPNVRRNVINTTLSRMKAAQLIDNENRRWDLTPGRRAALMS